jgi:hypothetical protein
MILNTSIAPPAAFRVKAPAMAVESKPLFHPEVMRQQVRSFNLPEHVRAAQPRLQHWANLITSGRADEFKETALLPDFLTDIFCGLLGYTGPAGVPPPGAPVSDPAPLDQRTPGRKPALLDCCGHSPDAPPYTLSRECHVEVDGEVADAALGRFQAGNEVGRDVSPKRPGTVGSGRLGEASLPEPDATLGKDHFIAVLEGKGTRDPLDRPFAGRLTRSRT